MNAEEIDALLHGLEVEFRSENAWDGNAFSGPKHWHMRRIIARKA